METVSTIIIPKTKFESKESERRRLESCLGDSVGRQVIRESKPVFPFLIMSEYESKNPKDDQLLTMTKRFVKYMVSLRCKMILKEELEEANLTYSITPHGGIEFIEEPTQAQLVQLNKNLRASGLELLDENDSMLIDRIINTIIEVVHYSDGLPNLSFKDIIGNKLGSGSESILKIFSDVKGISIMQFIILQKIERVKEFLLYDDLSLPEIAEKLRYKNEHYLIAQFKKYTGLSPGYFKELRDERMGIFQET